MRLNNVPVKGQVVAVKPAKNGHMVSVLSVDGKGGAEVVKCYTSKYDPVTEALGKVVDFRCSVSSDDMFVMVENGDQQKQQAGK